MGNKASCPEEAIPNTFESDAHQPELRDLIQQLGHLNVKDVLEKYANGHLGQNWQENDFDMIAKTCKGE